MSQFIKGMDVSSLLEVERCGGKFYDHGKQGDAMEILKGYGMNLVRLRLWNDPYSGDGVSYGGGGNNLETLVSLAGRVKNLGIGWLLDFHYSDFWTDPGKQTLPKAWKNLDMEELVQAVYDYTAQTLVRLRKECLLPDMVAVGNEVTAGLLWPYGKYPDFANIAKLIGAGIRAVRENMPEASVMIHLDQGSSNAMYREWFDGYLAAGGEDFDCIGLSYYPFWHGTLEMLKENLDDLAVRYGKELLVAEISTAFTMEDYGAYEKLLPEERKGMAATPKLAEKSPFPMTPEGQAEFMRRVMEIIRQVPMGLGKGFCYWEPAWLPVPGSGWASEDAVAYMNERGPGGNEWANQALFDYRGNALPALKTIRDF